MAVNESTWVTPVVLEGAHVRLEPLEPRHSWGLFLASRDPSVWTWLLMEQPQDLPATERFVSAILDDVSSGKRVCFVILRKTDGLVVGTTSMFDFNAFDRRLEIGHTWLAPEARRTAINTECKYLLLTHAFEVLDCARVQLKTDARNEASRYAIARIGASFEGVLRKYQRRHDGYVRDTAMFAITSEDWLTVKHDLAMLLGKAQQ